MELVRHAATAPAAGRVPPHRTLGSNTRYRLLVAAVQPAAVRQRLPPPVPRAGRLRATLLPSAQRRQPHGQESVRSSARYIFLPLRT